MKYILILLLLMPIAFSFDYYTDQMNFYKPRVHTQQITNDAIVRNITISIPNGFTILSSDCTINNPNELSCDLSSNEKVNYTLLSPTNCTESMPYYSNIMQGSTQLGKFTYVCLPDIKITDCKVEYGHGDANYLPNNELYISNERSTIFNLFRVWNIGSYLTPDESAKNATAKCSYPMLPVRTYGRVEIDYGNEVNGTFFWSDIESGYWFRIGVLSQDVYGYSISDTYNVSCGELTYQFKHHQVRANTTECDLEIRSQEPLTFTIQPHPTESGKSILTILNNEKYTIYDLSFDKLLGGVFHTETYRQLHSGEFVQYIIDSSSACNTTFFFIPSWQINSFNPIYYNQVLDCSNLNHPPVLDPIPVITQYVNTTVYYDSHATDIDNDNLTYYDNTTLFDINNITGEFIFNATVVANYSVLVSVRDPSNLSDSQEVIIRILPLPPSGPTSIPAPEFDIKVNNDTKSIDLNWTDVGGDYCNIYISINPEVFGLIPNVTNLTEFNWTHYTADQNQNYFYKVSCVKGLVENASKKIGCKYTYDVYSSADTLRGKNLISLACNKTFDAESFLQQVPYSSYLTRLDRKINPEDEVWESHPLGSTVNNFSMRLGEGYILFVTKTTNFTIAGTAILDSVKLDLVSSLDSVKGKNLVGFPYLNTTHNADSLITQTSYGSYITQLDRWNNPEIENWISHPRSSSVNNYPINDRGIGYVLFTTQNETFKP